MRPSSVVPLLALFAFGCQKGGDPGETDTGAVQDCSGTLYADADGDGFGDVNTSFRACEAPDDAVEDSTDCDDAQASTHPGATEVCDGVDQDCDGVADNGLDELTFYADTDGDGYGDPATSTTGCAPGDGFVEDDGDCDDSMADVHPNAIEVCDGVDQDCDGEIDEGADGAPTWYADADADGWGDNDSAVAACEAPEGTIATSGDCDDADPDVNPDASEICDGRDNDCNGFADDGATDAPTWYADADGDTYGDATVTAVACSAPPGDVADATDCDDTLAGVHPGATEVCDDGLDNDCDGTSNACDLTGDVPSTSADDVTTGDATSEAGYDVAWVGDVDGDGYSDAMIGAWVLSTSGTGTYEGGAYLSLGGSSSGGLLTLSSANEWSGENAGDYAGYQVGTAGDIDADGYDDILVAAFGVDGSGTDRGAAYVVYGGPTMKGGSTLAFADARLMGAADDDYAGSGVQSIGDADADGFGDYVVGAVSADDGVADAGAAYLFYGSSKRLSGDVDITTADATFVGYEADNDVGDRNAVGGADLDGDGATDVALGVWDLGSSPYGADVYGFYSGTGRPLTGTIDVRDGDFQLHDDAYEWGYLTALGAGDVDGDGLDDLVVGVDYAQTSYLFQVYLVSGSTTRMSGTSDVSTVAAATLKADNASDYYQSVSAGDIDADGLSDVVIGSAYNSAASSEAGGVFVFYGGGVTGTLATSAADAYLYGSSSGMWFGHAVAVDGDIDADGHGDLLVGAPEALASSGGAYLFLGTGL